MNIIQKQRLKQKSIMCLSDIMLGLDCSFCVIKKIWCCFEMMYGIIQVKVSG